MMSALDHDCNGGDRCAKVYLDPKLREFDECFGGKIRMGDIDGAVERFGYVLFLEWKSGGVVENFPQVKIHEELTRNSPKHISVWIVGDAATMRVDRIRVMARGKWRGEWEASSLEDLKARFSKWFSWVESGGRVAA